MPTIIDSLIVKLGLDSRDLNKQAPAATKQLKNIETQADETSASVDNITASLGKFLALLGGTVALKNFISDFIDTNAQLERFSRNIGLSVPTVSAWGNAVEEMGGNARDAQGTLDMLSKAQTELMLTGTNSLIPYFSALGVSLADVSGKARPVDQILLDLADRFSNIDRTQANNLGRMMGIDQNTLNLLLQGRKEVELTIQRQKDYAASTKAAGEVAVKFQREIIDLKQNITAFGRDLLVQAAPAIEKVLQVLGSIVNWVIENKEVVGDFFKIVGAGLIAIGVAAIPIDLTVASLLALAAAIALVYQDYQTWKRGGDSFIDWGVWKDRIDAVTNAIKNLRNELGKLEDKATSALNKIPGYKNFDKWYSNKGDAKALGGAASAAGSSIAGGLKSVLGIKDPAFLQKYFISKGWTPEQAAGIAANITAESSGNPNATGDKGTAYGLAQWHPDRQGDFAKFAGRDIKGSSLDQQLAFIQFELTQGRYKAAGDALKQATGAGESASIVSRQYERPGDADGEAGRRAALAQSMLGIRGASSTIAGASNGPPAPSAGNVDKSVTLQTGDITIKTNATDADGIARDFGQSFNYLFTSQFNPGLF